MIQNREHQTFHVGFKAFIANGEKLLILQDPGGLWELPGGRTEKGEIHKPLGEILLRETREELGDQFKYTAGSIFHAWIRKPDPNYPSTAQVYRDNDFCIFLVGVRCEYKGGDIALSPEHKDFRWVTKEEVENLEFENTYKEAVLRYFEIFKSVL